MFEQKSAARPAQVVILRGGGSPARNRADTTSHNNWLRSAGGAIDVEMADPGSPVGEAQEVRVDLDGVFIDGPKGRPIRRIDGDAAEIADARPQGILLSSLHQHTGLHRS